MLVRSFAVLLIAMSFSSLMAEGAPEAQPKKAKIKTYGPPVKLDITARRCIERGGSAYRDSLFYEEFNSMAACRAALRRS